MSWAVVFWVLYGVGSTLFVFYLFRVGSAVASSQNALVKQEIERIRREGLSEPLRPAPAVAGTRPSEGNSDLLDRMQIEHIFQPEGEHVAAQGLRNAAL